MKIQVVVDAKKVSVGISAMNVLMESMASQLVKVIRLQVLEHQASSFEIVNCCLDVA